MSNSRYIQKECPNCDSSDAYTIYDDGAHCFSCGYNNKKEKVNEMDRPTNSIQPVVSNESRVTEISSFSTYNIGSRNISKDTAEHFGVKMSVTVEGKPESHFYPYTTNGVVSGYKERRLPKQGFYLHGNQGNELFGQAQATGGKTLVITEGELDALAVSESIYKHYGRRYPVVSLPSATGTNTILKQREFVRAFESVVLMFDSDEAGEKAIENAAKIIGVGKVKIAKLKEKDPCDQLIKHGYKSVVEAYWNAKLWSPAGILTNGDIWKKYQDHKLIESIPYPTCLDGLNQKVKGMRQGEITLFTSGTGSGKSTVIKEILFDLVKTHQKKVGLVSLEESIHDTVSKFINMNRPGHDDEKTSFDNIFGDGNIVLLDHQGSVGDSSLIDQIEVMALMGCTHIVLDHITIAVSEGTDGLEGNAAIDKVMSDLLKIVKKHNIWLGLVSHLRKSMSGKSFEEGNLSSIDDIKGSGSIKQISFDIITFARDLVAQDDVTNRTIKLRVLKSRFTGLTGDAGSALYDRTTERLTNTDNADFQI